MQQNALCAVLALILVWGVLNAQAALQGRHPLRWARQPFLIVVNVLQASTAAVEPVSVLIVVLGSILTALYRARHAMLDICPHMFRHQV